MEKFPELNADEPRSNDHGWQTVVYPKRQRKTAAKPSPQTANLNFHGRNHDDDSSSVFHQLEEQAEARGRLLQSQKPSSLEDDVNPAKLKPRSDEEDDSEEEGGDDRPEGDKVEEPKKSKPKKQKKPKITVPEAASKIDSADLMSFLSDVLTQYELQQDIQLIRFADYFGRAFSSVSASQFPWTKIFRDSALAKIAEIPICHISEAVYRISVDWISQRSSEALCSFILWCLDSIFADLAIHQSISKGSKKGLPQQTPSKSQVAIFAVLAMVLRRKPDVLINLLPTLREETKYQGQDKLPVTVWVIAQAAQGDMTVGLLAWAHNLLPVLCGKAGSNPRSRDLILQLVERVLSLPKAQTILVNGAVRKGERLVPPSALETLARVTFPATSARVKATERFEMIYPSLKGIALSGSPGSKAMRQLAQQLMSHAVKLSGESIPELSKEGTGIFVWCLGQNPDCYKLWDKIYEDNLQASVNVLRRLTEDWKELPSQHFDPLKEALRSFRHKNECVLGGREEVAHMPLLKEANKYCKLLQGRVSRGFGCLKAIAFVVVAAAVGAVVMSTDVETWDWKKVSVIFSSLSSTV